ncbi:PAS domain-containing protein [Pedobacter sp. SYP-B3415]|uniref:PAS domain-containing protein n=1 Tax=Pedobacter sp. SYP-B3415 TaxID=2496641 RepID=UPI00101D382E|nr:PAS domain-containing protein [Pedobacter sp. SYP-B3415]
MSASEEILDLIPVVCFKLNERNEVTFINQAALVYFGRTRDACLNSQLADIFPEPEAIEAMTGINAAVKKRKPERLEYTSDLTKHRMQVTVAPAQDGTVVTIIDTLETPVGEKPERDEAVYRTLFNSMDEGFCIIEKLTGHPGAPLDFRYIDINPAFERHTGLKNVVGKTILQVVPDIEAVILDYYDHTTETGEPQQFVEYLAGLDMWLDASVIPLPQKNRIAVLFSNISARKKAEIALEETKSRLSVILEVLPVGIGFTDITGKLIFQNREMWYYMPTGLIPSQDQARAHRWWSWNPDGTLTEPENYPGAKALRGEHVVPGMEMLYMDDTGQKKWIQIAAVPVKDQNEQVTGHVCFITDIDSSKRASIALHRSEEQFRTLVKASSNMIYRMSADWKSMFSIDGRSMPALTGHAAEDWIKKYIPPGDRLVLRKKVNEAIRSKSILELEHRFYQPDGTAGWLYSRAVPVLDEKGNIQEWLAAGTDITLRKQAEEALRESEEKYRSLFNAIDEAFVVLELMQTADGQQAGIRILETNPSYDRMMRQPGAHPERTAKEIFKTLGAWWTGKFAEVIETGESRRYTKHFAESDAWYDIFMMRMGTEKNRRIALVFNDITERKRAEERQAYLLKLSDTLRPLSDTQAIHATVTHMALDYFQADRCYYAEIRNGEAIIRQDASVGGLPDLKGKYLLADTPIFDHVVQAGRPFIISNVRTNDLVDERLRRLYVNLQIISFIDIPIIKNGQATGVLCIVQTRERHWNHHEVEVAKEIAERSWAAVERAQAEEALRKHESQYRHRLEREVSERTNELRLTKDFLQGTLNSNPQMIQVFKALRNEQNEIIDFVWVLNNAASSQSYGNVIGRRLLEVTPGVVKEGIFDKFVEVVESGRPLQYEVQYRHEWFNGWFHQSVVKLDDGVATNTTNITERKNAEIALRESSAMLRTIYDTTLIGMSVFEPVRDTQNRIVDFRILIVNRKIERTWGRTDMVGKLYCEIFPGIKEIGLFDLMVETIETGMSGKMDYRYNFSGFDRWYSTMLVRGDEILVITNLDITERVNAEDERLRNYLLLRESEKLAQSGSWDLDLQSGKLSWSDGMYRLFHQEKGAEVRTHIYIDYATPASIAVAKRIVAHLRAGNREFEETLQIHAGGLLKTIQIKATVIRNESGQPVRILGVDLDITAMQEAERRLRYMEDRQHQELFQVSLNAQEEERRRISESLHNGVGQTLYGTRLALNNLNLDMARGNPEKFDEYKAYTADLLTESIREIRRISHELMPMVLAEFGLAAAVREVCDQLQGDTRFDCRVSIGTARMDSYIELAVFRTVQELMVNVVKHAQATYARVRIRVNAIQVTISVKDNGMGICRDRQSKPGIGLSSIRNKTDLLKGKITIQSEPGQGTAVEVRLPMPVMTK